jgi:hypothetical protein
MISLNSNLKRRRYAIHSRARETVQTIPGSLQGGIMAGIDGRTVVWQFEAITGLNRRS